MEIPASGQFCVTQTYNTNDLIVKHITEIENIL